MRAPLPAALALIATLLLAPAIASAKDPIVMDLRIDAPSVVTVGDHVTYTVVVEADAGTMIDLNAATLPPEVALVSPPETARTLLAGGREQVTISFKLAPFIAGDISVPGLPLRYTLPDGTTGEVETAGSVIQVTSVLPAAGAVTPRDLKPQAEIGEAPPTWPLPAIAAGAGILILLLVAFFLRRRVSRYRVQRALRRAPVFVGPEDEARARLDDAGAAYRATGDLTAYYTALGNTVRRYLTQRFDFPAFALTTREMETAMRGEGLDRWQIRVATGLLSQCDAVMYARYRPADERADADLTAAYEIVEMSRPEERPLVGQEEVAVS
jgi:hypothetical protein